MIVRGMLVGLALALVARGARADVREFEMLPAHGPAHVPVVALSVNPPARWYDAAALAGTAGVALSPHFALRFTVASYVYDEGPGALVGALAHDDGDEADYSGRFLDVALGFQVFPWQMWHGISFDAELLHRSRDTFVQEDSAASASDTALETQTLGARGHVSASYRHGSLLLAMGIGASIGREHGTRTTFDLDDERLTSTVDRTVVAPEGYLRIGIVFER